MARVKRGVTTHARHKKVLEQVKGQRGRRSTCIRTAIAAMEKAHIYAYRDRRQNKRNYRSLWIVRLNAALRARGINYNRFIPALTKGAGYRLVEIPVNHRPRRFGESKYGLGNRALRATIDMLGVRWLLARRLNHKIRGS